MTGFGPTHFPLTQEFLAFMLGVRRATVTVEGLSIAKGLEATARECYRAIRDLSD